MDELPVSDPCVWTKICGIATRQTLRIPREKCRAKGCFDAKKAILERVQLFFGAYCNTTEGPRSKGANCCACANEFCSARSVPLGSFQLSTGRSAPFFAIFFGEGLKKMTSLPVFLSLWILEVFAGPSDENISMIKVQTKYEKSPETLRFDLLKIKMCRGDSRPWRLVLRCWCFTCKIKLYVKTIVRYLFRWKRLI